MTVRDTLDIELDNIPYSFDIELDGNEYQMALNTNKITGQYVIDIWDNDDNAIYLGEPIVYGQPLWRGISDNRLPVTPIVPIDESGIEDSVTPGNLENTVFLVFDDLDGDSDG